MNNKDYVKSVIYFHDKIVYENKFNFFFFNLFRIPKNPLFYYIPLMILSLFVMSSGFSYRDSGDISMALLLIMSSIFILFFALDMKVKHSRAMHLIEICVDLEDEVRNKNNPHLLFDGFRDIILKNVLESGISQESRNISIFIHICMTISAVLVLLLSFRVFL